MKLKFLLGFLLLSNQSFSQTDILITDFQSGIPVDYTLVDNDNLQPAPQTAEYVSAWIAVLDPDNLIDTVASSTSFFSPTGVASNWLITPVLALGAYGNIIEWQAKSHDASFPDDYLVLVSTTDTQIASFTDTVGHVTEEDFEWKTRQSNLSNFGFNSQNIYVAFVNTTDNGFKLYIDDIHVWKQDPVSLNEIVKSTAVQLYPNPVNNILSVKCEETIENIEVVSMTGQSILKTTNSEIDFSTCVPGIYFVTIRFKSGSVTNKIVKN